MASFCECSFIVTDVACRSVTPFISFSPFLSLKSPVLIYAAVSVAVHANTTLSEFGFSALTCVEAMKTAVTE